MISIMSVHLLWIILGFIVSKTLQLQPIDSANEGEFFQKNLSEIILDLMQRA